MKLFFGLMVVGLLLNGTLARGQIRIQGGGATFPNPLYQRWVSEFQKLNPTVQIEYQAIGSGGGIRGITDKTFDFAGSDAPLTKKEIAALGGPEAVVQVPSTSGAVVLAVNLPDAKDLKLSGQVVADIFLGKISKWNDAKIAELNSGMSLPDTAITPVYRTDGSGTNFVFTSYLATQSDEFRDSVGTGKQVKWPLGQGGKGSDGVTAVIKQTAGAIGYVEQAYADQNQLTAVALKNAAGQFVKASSQAVTAAGASGAEKMNGTVLAADIWNAAGNDAYPIASFTYLIVYKDLNNIQSKEKADALDHFLNWALTDGQKFCGEMDYAPLPDAVAAKAKSAVKQISFKGEALTVSQ